MSPLWRDEIGVHLSPRRLCMVRLKRGVKPTLLAEHEEECKPAQANEWTAALQALDTLLAQPVWRGALLRVVIADSWARYAIVPWVSELSSTDERVGHARQLLASTYGDAVSDWEVRLSEAPPESPRVACTIPVALLEGLRAVCARQDVKLASLQPQLVAAYDGWRHRLPAAGAWFVTVDEGTLAAARIGRTGWDRVYSVRIGSDWARELKRLQTFGRLASASPDEGQVFVDAPQAWREVAGAAGQDLQWLEEDSAPMTTLQRLARARRLAA
ncbi:MAG: hypothetical protein JWN85_5155 [Gammaproteobacteria bacterium]|nr:hypothetical protein [Gammaproteobacteria bacterium]